LLIREELQVAREGLSYVRRLGPIPLRLRRVPYSEVTEVHGGT
jgi:hypothetical protein